LVKVSFLNKTTVSAQAIAHHTGQIDAKLATMLG